MSARPSKSIPAYHAGDLVRTRDGLDLFVRTWRAEHSPAGTVVVVHGLGEHAGRYGHVAQQLARGGWDVLGYDQRGHGFSCGARGKIRKSDDLLDDLAAVIDQVPLRREAPIVLLGHSMGGAVAARFVAESTAVRPAPWWRPVDGLILTSPALVPRMSKAQVALAAALTAVSDDATVSNGVDAATLALDPVVAQRYREDPLVHDRVCAKLVNFVRHAGQATLAAAASWSVPTFVAYPVEDALVDVAAIERFFRSAPRGWVEAHRFVGARHELLNDYSGERLLTLMSEWLRDLLAAVAPSDAMSRTA